MSRKPAQRLAAWARTPALVTVAAVVAVTLVAPAGAVDLSPSSGKFSLNIDTTLSWGARTRVEDRDPALISPFEGGTAWSVNGDDGNLNFDKGLVSNTLKATIDVDFAMDNFGVFLRGSGFYDHELEDDCCERTELTDEALSWAGHRTELLDAFAWWRFNIGGSFGEIRAGQQVLNWGESTFIQGGLSVINPVDVSALRVPGSELREAYRPLGMVWGSLSLTQNVSVEGFYQYDWEPIVIDPPGTYFSTNDFVGPGGEYVFLAFASFPDTGESPPYVQPPVDYPFMGVPRTTTAEPEDGGQYGFAVRLYVPEWNGTEFGLYYLNYHSRLPIISGVTGTVQGAMAAQTEAAEAALLFYALVGVPPGVSPAIDAQARQVATAVATSTYAHTANWFTAYPEDIKLYGLSWNAQIGTTGIAFQGEVTYREDNPYQVDDVELLFAALSPLSPFLAEQNQVAPGGVGFETTIDGYRRLDSSQLQFTLTRVFATVLGADQGVVVGEFGFHKVYDMPSKDVLRFEGPGTYTSGNPVMSEPGGAHAGKAYERPEHFADDFSWGYRLAGRLDYNNAIGAWALSPRMAWSHDVEGVSPGPGGNFVEGVKAFTVGVQADYQNRWQLDLSYTSYGGGGRWNLINDRDFVGGFVKYSF